MPSGASSRAQGEIMRDCGPGTQRAWRESTVIGRSAFRCLDVGKTIVQGRILRLALVIVIGVLASSVSFWLDRGWERERHLGRFQESTHDRLQAMQRALGRNLLALRSLAGLWRASKLVEQHEFERFSDPLISVLPSVQSFGWVPLVTEDDRAAFEGGEGSYSLGLEITERGPDGDAARAGPRMEYFPLCYIHPIEGNQTRLGCDLGAVPKLAQVLARARDTGQIAATSRVPLPGAADSAQAVFVFVPVYRNGEPTGTMWERRESLLGFGVGVYSIGAIVEEARADLSEEAEVVRLMFFDDSAPPGERLLYSPDGREDSEPDGRAGDRSAASFIRSIRFADRTWTMRLTPTPEAAPSRLSLRSVAVLLVGLILTALLAGIVHLLQSRATKVMDANRELTLQVERRREAQEQLVDSENRYRATFEQAAVGIAQVAPDGRYLRVNDRLCEILGYDRPELLERTVEETTHPADASGTQVLVRHGSSDEVSTHRTEKRFVRKDGQVVWAYTTDSYVRDAHGRPKFFISVVQDITDRKRSEEARKVSEERLRKLTETARDAIIGVDRDGLTSFWNEAAEHMFGHTSEEALGQVLVDLIFPAGGGDDAESEGGWPPEDLVTTAASRSPIETTAITKNGDEIPVEVSAAALEEEGGWRATLIIRDIRARRREEAARYALYRISEAVSTSESLDDLYRSIHSSLGGLMPVGNFFIALQDDVGEMLRFPYFVDEFDDPPASRCSSHGPSF